LGNIAIDDIAMVPGVCPTSPQVASPSGGDCAFEDDFCGWKNPERRDNIDEINWDRTEARTLASGGGSSGSGLNLLKASSGGNQAAASSPFPQTDHTTGSRDGYYMALSRNSVQRAGDRAILMSEEIESTDEPMCMSFWYYMYEPIVGNTGPELGKLNIWVRSEDRNGNIVLEPIWRLQNGQGPSWKYAQAKVKTKGNFQVLVEGVWGNNRVSGFIAIDDVTFFNGDCDVIPNHANLVVAECTFDRDSCSWRNTSTGDFEWRMATLNRRPSNLPDKTFGAPVGYAYFDIFNSGSRQNRVKMISPTIPGGDSDSMCFSFWFAAFGAGETTSLRIYRRDASVNDREIDEQADPYDDETNSATIWVMSATNLNTARPEWMSAQVTVNSRSDFKIIMEGKATNGGYAIDQLVFSSGKCSIRPKEANPNFLVSKK